MVKTLRKWHLETLTKKKKKKRSRQDKTKSRCLKSWSSIKSTVVGQDFIKKYDEKFVEERQKFLVRGHLKGRRNIGQAEKYYKVLVLTPMSSKICLRMSHVHMNVMIICPLVQLVKDSSSTRCIKQLLSDVNEESIWTNLIYVQPSVESMNREMIIVFVYDRSNF